jgi:hypothetical protein
VVRGLGADVAQRNGVPETVGEPQGRQVVVDTVAADERALVTQDIDETDERTERDRQSQHGSEVALARARPRFVRHTRLNAEPEATSLAPSCERTMRQRRAEVKQVP